LDAELVSPATGEASVWTRGGLRPLPAGLVVGVPTGLSGLVRSGLLSPAGVARAGLDLVLPRTLLDGDVSVGRLVRARFGDEAADRLVDPLLGGIHAGCIDDLSLAATAPQLDAAARQHRSLLLGLRSQPRPPAGAPVFHALRGGMQRLVDAMAGALGERGVVFRTGHTVTALPDADGVVVATPAPAAAALVGGEAGEELRRIRAASVTLVTLAWPLAAFPRPLPGSGFLVPRVDGRLMTACSFGSNKWPHWSDDRTAVLRVSAGRAGDERAMSLGDDEVVAALVGELREAVGVRGEPAAVRITRWPDGFPQYEPGHLDRVARMEAALARDLPHVRLAGGSLRGVGLPACIGSGRAAARALLPDC
jgi:oxygen-dependent protoporphyrinogen oxidase